MTIVYLNGDFIDQNQASVSVMDRGFLFGDGVYEAMPIYGGRIFSLSQHLARLDNSLNAIKMEPPLSDQQWQDMLQKLLKLNDVTDGDHCLYLQVTRGVHAVRNHAIPEHISPTVFAACLPPKKVPPHYLTDGMAAITLPDNRRADCFIKAVSLLPNILAFHQAQQAGCHEAIFIRDGLAMEATSSNLFIVKDGMLTTPPLNKYILAGVTRDFLLQLARDNQIPCQEAIISENELHHADEIWLSGSLKEAYPIVQLDGKPVGDGKIGPLWQKIMPLYRQYCKQLLENQHG